MATPTFSIAGNPFLPDNPPTGDDLAKVTLLAEYALGVHDLSLSGDDLDAMTSAVAMQVAFMLDNGTEVRKYSSRSDGQRSRQSSQAAQMGIDPVAARIVSEITGGQSNAHGTFDVVTHL